MEACLTDKVPVSQDTKTAIYRQVRDLQKPPAGYYYDPKIPNRLGVFLETLHLPKGQPGRLELLDFQCLIIASAYGWYNEETGYRRFKNCFFTMGRKNGKSTLLAGLAIAHLCNIESDDYGPEIYAAATQENQASIITDSVKAMLQQNEPLRSRYQIQVMSYGEIRCRQNRGLIKALPKPDPGALQGKNTSVGICDEVAYHKKATMIDALRESQQQRPNSCMWYITTAGVDMRLPAYEMMTTYQKINEGQIAGEHNLYIPWKMDKDDSWEDPVAWQKANPMMPYSVPMQQDFRMAFQDAKNQSTKRNEFLRARCNMYVAASTVWIKESDWHKCRKPVRDEWQPVRGEECFVGIDLAARLDLASVTYCFRRGDKYYIRTQCYLPQESETYNREPDFYGKFVERGELILTPEATIDYDIILADIIKASRYWNIVKVVADPAQAVHPTQTLRAHGLDPVLFGQGNDMSQALADLESVIVAGKLQHEGNTCQTWQFLNAEMKHFDNGYMKLDKTKTSINKVDSVESVAMALYFWLAEPTDDDEMPMLYGGNLLKI